MDFRDRMIEAIQEMDGKQWFTLMVAAAVLILGVLLVSDNVEADGHEYVLNRIDCSYMANKDCGKQSRISIRFYPETGLCGWNCLPYTTTTTPLYVDEFKQYRWVTWSCSIHEFTGLNCG